MDLEIKIQKFPERLQPNILVSHLNEPIEIISQGLSIKIKKDDLPRKLLNGIIRFIWLPQEAIEFEGICKGEETDVYDLDKNEATLLISGFSEEIPIIINKLTPNDFGWKVRGIFQGCAVRRTKANADKLIFHLVNFPDYIGQFIHNIKDGVNYEGRISFESEQWIGVIDSIPEAKHLTEERKKNGGFYISHVGEIRPINKQYLDESQLNLICTNLHYLFGFCCGSWCGPFFPQGIFKNEIIWEQIAAWQTGSSKIVPTWFPTRTCIDELRLFSGFLNKINDPVFSSPLRNAIAWYIEVNKPEMANEGKIVLTQVGLEMLSWAYLVDYKHSFTEVEFNNNKAEIKIRMLLTNLGIKISLPENMEGLGVPEYMEELYGYSQKIHKDIPSILTSTRNAIIHSTEKNRRKISKLNGIQLYQIAQMGIGLIELSILAICEYNGAYARRGWRGWKGEDEISVPWIKKK